MWADDGLYAWFGTDAAHYDTASDTWQPIPPPALSPRSEAVVAWAGSMLVVWGGTTADGARYDPATGVWQSLAMAPITPRARTTAATAFSDRELFVWGGRAANGDVVGDGAAYDPVTDHWQLLPVAPLTARAFAAATWTGTELIVWGGTATPTANTGPLRDGAAYNPATKTWRTLAAGPLDPGIASAVWTGHNVVFGPTRSGNANGMFASSTAASYDPATDTWRAIPLGIGHPGFTAGWDGRHILLFAKGGGIAVDPTTGAHTDIILDHPLPDRAAIMSNHTNVYVLGEGQLLTYTP